MHLSFVIRFSCSETGGVGGTGGSETQLCEHRTDSISLQFSLFFHFASRWRLRWFSRNSQQSLRVWTLAPNYIKKMNCGCGIRWGAVCMILSAFHNKMCVCAPNEKKLFSFMQQQQRYSNEILSRVKAFSLFSFSFTSLVALVRKGLVRFFFHALNLLSALAFYLICIFLPPSTWWGFSMSTKYAIRIQKQQNHLHKFRWAIRFIDEWTE